MLNDLADHFAVPREKMVRIYNPVDFGKIRQLAEADRNPYAGVGPHLVAVGRLSSEKGYDLLLDAMALVHEALPHAQLTILGTGPLEAALRAQQGSLGLAEVVRFVGFAPNPYPYFRHADLFVLSSHYEGFPNALLEALTLGTRVVATDCPGGVREILRGCSGYKLVNRGDPPLLADAILQVLMENGHHAPRVEKPCPLSEFDIPCIMAQYEALFQKVIDACPA
jgi:glycosyltransferase involved in cell wall biosynthesis